MHIEQKRGDGTPWKPKRPRIADETLVPASISYKETNLKGLARSAGDKWDSEKRVWIIRYARIKRTALEKHIVLDAF